MAWEYPQPALTGLRTAHTVARRPAVGRQGETTVARVWLFNEARASNGLALPAYARGTRPHEPQHREVYPQESVEEEPIAPVIVGAQKRA